MAKGRNFAPSTRCEGNWYYAKGYTRKLEKPTLTKIPSPPPGFQCKASQMSFNEFPFSMHDNRNAFQGHGIYFGSGFGKRKLPEKRYQCSINFLPLAPTKTPKSCYTTSYKFPAILDSSNDELRHRRYPRNLLMPKSSCTERPDTSMKLLTSTDSSYKTPLHILAITQQPFLRANTWVYSYKPKEYNQTLGL